LTVTAVTVAVPALVARVNVSSAAVWPLLMLAFDGSLAPLPMVRGVAAVSVKLTQHPVVAVLAS
jgi:hypothetical protein